MALPPQRSRPPGPAPKGLVPSRFQSRGLARPVVAFAFASAIPAPCTGRATASPVYALPPAPAWVTKSLYAVIHVLALGRALRPGLEALRRFVSLLVNILLDHALPGGHGGYTGIASATAPSGIAPLGWSAFFATCGA